MKVILVDDEKLALNYLERQLLKQDGIDVIGRFTNPLLGREQILQQDVDVVFLDISLPEINGIELAEQILERKPNMHVVFVTAYNEHAVKAFELNALDYIVKPIAADRLVKTIDRIRDRIKTESREADSADRTIRMNVLKQVAIETSPGEFSIMQWRTTKAQELFLYLLQHRGQLVRKSALIELLWPEYEMDKVYSQLYTAVYHIRKTLEPHGERFQITNTTEGYILKIQDVMLDVEEWEMKLSSLLPLTADNIDRCLEMMKLYTGHYLQEHDYWWAESERQRITGLWLEAAFAIAKQYVQQNKFDQAITSYNTICKQHPLEEEAYFALMKIYDTLHNYYMVQRQYEQLTDVFVKELNEQPSSYITEWYNLWKVNIVQP
nr:response regulator [Paenibacillus fonticola]